MAVQAVTILKIAPCSISDARRFVGQHHRHNLPPKGGLFAARVVSDGNTVGVVIVGRPVARALDDGATAEVTRCCTDGTANACSMLYGAAKRAAKALGWERLITYTLETEAGASLTAAGWQPVADLPARAAWVRPAQARYQTDLFGNERRPPEPKTRWQVTL